MCSFRRFYPAASLTFFSQHFQDHDYLSSVCKFVVRRLGSAWILHRGPPLLNSQVKLQEYVKSVQGLEAFQWVGLAVFLLGWIQQYRLHSILVGALLSAFISSTIPFPASDVFQFFY